MTESEKFSLLVNLQCEKSKVRITTVENAIYHCKLLGQCEDGDEYAYEFFSSDYPTKFFALDCDFIKRIEAISEDEWQQHLKNKIHKNSCTRRQKENENVFGDCK